MTACRACCTPIRAISTGFWAVWCTSSCMPQLCTNNRNSQVRNLLLKGEPHLSPDGLSGSRHRLGKPTDHHRSCALPVRTPPAGATAWEQSPSAAAHAKATPVLRGGWPRRRTRCLSSMLVAYWRIRSLSGIFCPGTLMDPSAMADGLGTRLIIQAMGRTRGRGKVPQGWSTTRPPGGARSAVEHSQPEPRE